MKNCIAAAVAATIMMGAPVAHADDTLGKVVGAVAQGLVAQKQAQQEQAYWNAAVQRNTTASYSDYLDKFPQGAHAALAREQIARRGGSSAVNNGGYVPGAAQAEAALGLSNPDRQRVQRALANKGFYRSGVDGAFGPGTRRSIADWQRAAGYSATGYLTAAQYQTLSSQAGGASTPTAPAQQGTRGAQGELEANLSRSQRAQVQMDLTALGYDTRGHDGVFGSASRHAIQNWQQSCGLEVSGYLNVDQVNKLRSEASQKGVSSSSDATERQADTRERLIGMNATERAQVQRKLNALGYATGGADGNFGWGTRAAIRQWQSENGRSVTGYLTADDYHKLLAQTGPSRTDGKAQAEAASAEARLIPDSVTRTLVERRLQTAGFNPGKVDGTFTPETRAAIRAWQKARGLSQTAYIDSASAQRMLSEIR